jgi:hypothetical protein
MFHRRRAIAAAGLAFALDAALGRAAAAGEQLSPRLQLQETFGLVHHAEKVWLLPRELELRERLAELPKHRDKATLVEKELDDRIQQNRRAWQDSQPTLVALKKSLARLASNDPQRDILQKQVDALQSAAVEPRRLGAQSEVCSRVVELSSERCAILASASWIRHWAPLIAGQYERLAQDAKLNAALKKLGPSQRLGPLKSYEGDVRRLAEYERLAAPPWVPIFLSSGQTRLGALLNDEQTVTFSWSDASATPLVLTSSVSETLGLPTDGRLEGVELDRGRTARARPTSIQTVRLGQCQLSRIAAFVLPPEAEDLGCWIGKSVLQKQRVRLEPERLRLWIEQ